MMTKIRTIQPGVLVSLKTHSRGGVRYEKRSLESAHVVDSGAEVSRWETGKVVFDPEERKEAGKVLSRASYLIRKLCSPTPHGLLCPRELADELQEAIDEGQRMVDAFNGTAYYTRIEVNAVRSEVVAADEATIARAVFAEIDRFMAQMQEGLEALDVDRVRDICKETLKRGQILPPESSALMSTVIKAARSACNRIVDAGEQVAVEIDQSTISFIGTARNSFLDFSFDELPVEVESSFRTLDLEQEAS